jgi:RNA polymerase sigma-70 factor, ECF subfamily
MASGRYRFVIERRGPATRAVSCNDAGSGVAYPAGSCYNADTSTTYVIDESALRTTATTLLESTSGGDADALDQLVSFVYDELKRMARRQRGNEYGTPTLHTTELVHEVYLRLIDSDRVSQKGRAYFFAAAARAMRQVLVDSARRRTAAKRGGGAAVVTLDEAAVLPVDAYAADLLDLHSALNVLEEERPRLARVVELRFFGGLGIEEAADILEVSPRTIKSDWALARAWLFSYLGGNAASDGGQPLAAS